MLNDLKIDIYADGANLDSFKIYNEVEYIKGFTTNPTLMKKAGIKNYKNFALDVLEIVKKKSVSFEVFSDDISEMEDQAREISSWGNNVVVKIPITNTKKISTIDLIGKLSESSIKCNVTAIFLESQLKNIKKVIKLDTSIILSIFAGRIADTGIDPSTIIKNSVNSFKNFYKTKILWASPRELLNLFQANNCGCHIITMDQSLLNKISYINKNLEDYSLETVKMFYNDAAEAGYKIDL